MEKSNRGKNFRWSRRICCQISWHGKRRIKVTEGLLGWADFIFVMERRHAERLKSKFSEALAHKKIICLDIPDHLTYTHPELVELLKDRLSEHIDFR